MRMLPPHRVRVLFAAVLVGVIMDGHRLAVLALASPSCAHLYVENSLWASVDASKNTYQMTGLTLGADYKI